MLISEGYDDRMKTHNSEIADWLSEAEKEDEANAETQEK
jgi:hypothetical protein